MCIVKYITFLTNSNKLIIIFVMADYNMNNKMHKNLILLNTKSVHECTVRKMCLYFEIKKITYKSVIKCLNEEYWPITSNILSKNSKCENSSLHLSE